MKKSVIFFTTLLLTMLLLTGCKMEESVQLRVGAMKGPTSIGILPAMAEGVYEFHMATAADELAPLLAKGELDIALVPANVAAVLFQKMEGNVRVLDINTLGVLYFVTAKEGVTSIDDLRGKTIYLTGKGTTPEAVLKYVLRANGLTEDEYTLEFKSEPTEVAAVLAQTPEAIGLLPQPFVTAALSQNEALQICLDLNEEWSRLQPDGQGMVTGVTVVRKEVLENHSEAVEKFLNDHRACVDLLKKDVKKAAKLTVDAGILPNEKLAEVAIPKCNIVCITGEQMREMLGTYLNVLAEFDTKLVGGYVPTEEFYYIEKE